MDSVAERAPRPAVRALLALAVALAAALPFLRAVAQPFVAWDDDVNFLQNQLFRGLGAEQLQWMWSSFHLGHFMPLTWMTCALDYELFGLDPAAFHATSIAWHALTALLLYFALAELLARAGVQASWGTQRFAAAVGALSFAVHPLRVESVAWATERRDVVSGALLALSAWLWLRSQRPDAARSRLLVLSVASFAASLLAKVSGMALPLVLLALDAWPLRRAERQGWRALLVEKLPYLALALGGALLGWFGQRESTTVLASLDQRSLGERLAISAWALRFYLRKTLLPLGLSPFYELPREVDPLAFAYLPAIAFAALATGFLFVQRRRSPALACAWTAWLAFGLLVAPVIGLVHAGRQIAADRYTYLPSFALAAALAAACAHERLRRYAFVPALLLLPLAALAWRQVGYWRDSQALFARVVAIEPRNGVGHAKLGILAHERGDYAAALEHYGEAIAAGADGGRADALYDRSLTLLALGRREEALADVRAALELVPQHPGALRVLADDLVAAGQVEQACKLFRDALAARPADVELHLGFALVCLGARREAEALAAAARAAELDPRSPQAFFVQGTASLYLGRFERAEAALRRALALGGEHGEALYQLGLAVSRQGREGEARALWERALAAEPDHAGARARLGR